MPPFLLEGGRMVVNFRHEESMDDGRDVPNILGAVVAGAALEAFRRELAKVDRKYGKDEGDEAAVDACGILQAELYRLMKEGR